MIQEKEGVGVRGRVRWVRRRAETGEVIEVGPWSPNLVVSGAGTGRNLIAQRLVGTNTYSLNVTHLDIGTGNATPANGDTALTAAVVRAALVLASASNNVASLQFFLSDAALPDGTYYEVGAFVDGSGALGSGRMFNHALFGTPYVKATGEDTTIEVDFTIN